MLFAADIGGFAIGIAQLGIVPTSGSNDMQANTVFIGLETLHDGADIFFSGLVFGGHGYAISIVPNAHEHGHLHNARGVHDFPKDTFRSRGITDGTECDFTSFLGKLGEFVQQFVLFIEFGCNGET